MTKGIIVISIPESCKDCIAYKQSEYGDYCNAVMKFLTGKESKSDFCPIKKLPEYRPEVEVKGETSWFAGDSSASITATGRINKENIGWNECLDTILKGETP